MTAVFKREVSSYFKGVLGYLFAAFTLMFCGIYTMSYNLSGAYSNFEYVLDSISFLYIVAVPVLSMRTVAEELSMANNAVSISSPCASSSKMGMTSCTESLTLDKSTRQTARDT